MPEPLNPEFAITDALVDVLTTLAGLHTYFFPVPDMQPVFAFPLLAQDFNVRWSEESGPLEGDLVVGVPWVQGLGRAAARSITDYTSPTGEKSISALLNGHQLGGAVRSIHVKGVGRWEVDTLPGDISLLVRPLRIQIFPPQE